MLFIWVEGDDEKRGTGDDIRFFKRIMKPIFEKKYDRVEVLTYAKKDKKSMLAKFKTIQQAKADYIIVGDINSKPCISQKKEELKKRFSRKISDQNITVAIPEIESWYLAGINKEECKKLGIKYLDKTDQITKENFNALIPKNSIRIEFMLSMVEHFDIPTAKQQNKSFHYFCKKYGIG